MAICEPGDRPALDEAEALAMHVQAAGHELHNLFTHLLFYSGMLAETFGHSDDRELVSSLRHSIDLGIAASRNLMLVARRVGGEPVAVDLKLVLSELQRMGESRLPSSVVVATDYPPELPRVNVPLIELYQQLARVCHRLSDALPNGGTVLLRAENAESATEEWDAAESGARQVRVMMAALDGCDESEAIDSLERLTDRQREGHRIHSLAELEGASSQPMPGMAALFILGLPVAEQES